MSPEPPSSPATAPSSLYHWVTPSRWLALGGALCLIALGLGWELSWARTGSGTLALKVVPLVLALTGLWRMRLYTYRWVSLAVWLYVTEGLVRASSESGLGAWLAAAEVALGLLLFGACGLHVRARLAAGRALGLTAAARPGPPESAGS